MTFDEAKAHLADLGWIDSRDGGLYNTGAYIGWTPGDKCVVLDGSYFEPKDLMAIAIYVEGYDAHEHK